MNESLFKDAIAIIDGIPEARLKLESWQSQDGIVENTEKITCNTIACAGGWLALHPTFQAMGLFPSSSTGMPVLEVNGGYRLIGSKALAHIFDMPIPQAQDLFSSRTTSEYEDFPDESDRQIWLRRAKNLLESNQINHGW